MADAPQVGRLPDIRIRLSDVLITALVPAFVYLAAYTEQFGYYAYFTVPPEFIRLDWVSAFEAMLKIENSTFYLSFLPLLLLLSLANYTNDHEFFHLSPLLLAFVFLNIILVHYFIGNLLVWVDIVLILLMLRLVKRWREKGLVFSIDESEKHATLQGWFALTFGRQVSMYTLNGVIALLLIFDAGWSNAQAQTTFLATVGQNRMAVVVNNGDVLVLAPYHRADKKDCSGSEPCYIREAVYVFKKLSDREDLRLYRKALGTLRVHPQGALANAPWWRKMFASWLRSN